MKYLRFINFWYLTWRADSLEKTLMLGKIEDKRRRGWQRMSWLDNVIDSMDMNLSKLQETEEERGIGHNLLFHPSVQFSSVTQSCPTLCDPVNRSTPGLSVYHQLPEFTHTQVHRGGDAIQPSHPLSSPSPPAPNSSQHQSFPMSQLFAWVGQITGVSALASVLPKNTQSWSPSEWTGWISLQSKGLSRVFSNTTVQKHQFFGAQLSSQSNSHIHTWPQEKP